VRGAEGNLVVSLFKAVGSTLSQVLPGGGPPADFELETPAASARVLGTTPRVTVAADGVTEVANLPDGSDSVVLVQAKDPARTELALPPGLQTRIVPGQPPSAPEPVSAVLGASPAVAQTAQEQQERQHRREQQQAQAEAAAVQAQAALAAVLADEARLAQQEAALRAQLAQLLGGSVPGTGAGPNDRQRIGAGLVPDGSGPCATLPGTVCTADRDLAGSVGTLGAGMQWRVQVATGRLPPGAIATVFLPTTMGIEFFDCQPALAGQLTLCTGATRGTGLQGGAARVFAANGLLAQGRIVGPGAPPSGPTRSLTATSTLLPRTPTATSLPGTPTPRGARRRSAQPPRRYRPPPRAR
jgi:hypothetical protein